MGVVSGSRCGADMLARVLPWVRRKELGERRGKGGESSKPTTDEAQFGRELVITFAGRERAEVFAERASRA